MFGLINFEVKEKEEKGEVGGGKKKRLVKIGLSRGNEKQKAVWRESLIKKSRVFNYQENLLE